MSSTPSTPRRRTRADPLAGRKPDPMPAFVPPCLASLTDTPPAGDTWVHEIKFDGYRLQARIADGSVQLLTRTGLDWTMRFPAIAKALRGLKVKSALIDGEAVVEDADGVPSFVKLVEALDNGSGGAAMRFMTFDLLYLNGINLTSGPFLERKELLQSIMKTSGSKHLRYSAHIAGDADRVLKEACTLGLEGVVSKKIGAPYRSGRNGDWLKSKCIQADEFVIGGYLVSSVDAKAVGALALGTFDGGKLVYRGRVGTGFTHDRARAVWQALQPIRRATSPFASSLTAIQRRGVVWVEPTLVAQIAYRGWTGDDLLRHAAFKGLRADKPAKQVRRP